MADSIKIIKLNVADYARLRAARPDPIEIKGKMYAWDDSVVYVNADTDEVFAQEQISLDALSATVSSKVDTAGGGATNKFGWKLDKDGFRLNSTTTSGTSTAYKEVFSVKKDGKVSVSGNLYVGGVVLDKAAVKATELRYALTNSPTIVPEDSEFIYDSPEWTEGKYIWQRLRSQYIDGTFGPATKSCIQGAKGETGEQGPQGIQGAQGEKGDAGTTPHVGENGNWWIGTVDTGIKAEGADGSTPYVGTNGNWWIGTEDTGVKAEGKSPYYISMENDFDSIPCSSDGTIPATYDWENETKHTITILKGTTQQTFNVAASGTTLTDVLTLVYEPENVTYVPGSPVLSVSTYSAHITSISADVGCVNYKLYFEKKLVGVGKFEASKAFSGEDAVDYKLVSSAKEIKILKSTGAIEPASITFNFYKQTGQSEYSTYNGYYGYKIDNGTEIFGQAESLTLTSQTHYTKNNTVINVILYQDATHTKKYDTETVFILKDGEDGEKGEPGENAPVIVSVLPYYALGIDETTAPTTDWALTPPVYESGKYYWYKEITTYDNETTTESTPVPHKGLNGSYALAQGKSTTTWSVSAPDNPKTGDCWFDKANNLLKQWNGTAWEDIGDELVAKKVTAEYINSKHITAEKISVVQGENKIFEADGLSPTGGTVMIGGFNVDNKSIHTGTFDPADPGSTGVYVGTDGIYLGQKFSVDTSGHVTASDLTLTGYATNDDVATAKSEAISTASSDATTKANNAKTAAINTAAEDATTKANAAKTAAEQDATSKVATEKSRAEDVESALNTKAQTGIDNAAIAQNKADDAYTLAGKKNTTTYSDTAPTDPAPKQGDCWFDTANNILKQYTGSTWKDIGGSLVAATVTAGQIAGKDITAKNLTVLNNNNKILFKADGTNKTVQIGGFHVDNNKLYSGTLNTDNYIELNSDSNEEIIYQAYKSTNQNEDDTTSGLMVTFNQDYDKVIFYIRHAGDNGNSYQVTSELNDGSTERFTTYDEPNWGTDLDSYSEIAYENIHANDYFIAYYTKGSGSTYVSPDTGYILIPNNINCTISTYQGGPYPMVRDDSLDITITTPLNAITAGTKFKVDHAGNLTSTSGDIGGFKIGSTSLSAGTVSTDSYVSLGTDKIVLGNNNFIVTNTGELSASDANLTAATINKTTISNGTISNATINTSNFKIKDLPIDVGYSTTNNFTVSCSTSEISTQNRVTFTLSCSTYPTKAMTVTCYQQFKAGPGLYKTIFGTISVTTTATRWTTTVYLPTSWRGMAVIADSDPWCDPSGFSSGGMIKVGDNYIPIVTNGNNKKYKIYVWTYTSTVSADYEVKCLATTHGCSTVIGAVACARYTSAAKPDGTGLSGYNHNAKLCTRISGSTVAVGNDDGTDNDGFYCIIIGY